MYWITPDGSYYEGDAPVADGSLSVTQRPASNFQFIDGIWVDVPPPPPSNAELLAQTDQYMSRVTEDTVVNLLLKGTVSKADYPQIVWDRINYRRSLRNQQPI